MIKIFRSLHKLAAPVGSRRRAARPARPGLEPLEGHTLLSSFAADFNGDLAVGAPGEDVGDARDAGAVTVIYGSAFGLTDYWNQIFNQDSDGVPGTAEAGDRFGSAVAVADLNGDGFSDLAIGVPGEDVGNARDAGAVSVVFGSAWGLTSWAAQLWHQDSDGVAGAAGAGDHFGASLAVGDFNGDGRYDDLAVGVPDEDVGSAADAGAVDVLYGTFMGLTGAYSQIFHQGNLSNQGKGPEAGDRFGFSLAVADFNLNGYADLAVGIPFENVGSAADAGAVDTINGSRYGLIDLGTGLWMQDNLGAGRSERGDHFGWSLAAGDFNGDWLADLAVGAPEDDAGTLADAGAVVVFSSDAWGLNPKTSRLWRQGSDGVPGAAEAGDRFGASLVAGGFNGDLRADLAVGAPGERVGASPGAGAIVVLYGNSPTAGLTAVGARLWHQDSTDIRGEAEPGDGFGASMAAADFNRDGRADLAVGVPGERVGSDAHAGAVDILYGAASGLSAAGNQLWDQDSPNVRGAADAGDSFGAALAAFNSGGGNVEPRDTPPSPPPPTTTPKAPLGTPLDRLQRTSPFGFRADSTDPKGRRMHEGVDYAAAIGTPVKAADGGRVVVAGWTDGYGYNIVIKHSGGWYTRYAHLSRMDVRFGQDVVKGRKIGDAGDTGVGTGAHLHFELRRDGPFGQPLDPEKYLGKDYRSLGVLLDANPEVRRGDGEGRRYAGSAVDDLQSTLKRLGYHVTGDGVFGPSVEAAVKSFQRKSGLSPSGVVGRDTWKALAAALPKASAPPEGSIAWGAKVSPDFKRRVVEVAEGLGIKPDDLMAVMAFETGETFSPKKSNAKSNAIGLIQFLPSTAKSLGTTTAELGQMSAVRQLDFVEKYLRAFESTLRDHHSLADVYMAVFAPVAIAKPTGTVLHRKGTLAYTNNAPLDADGDGAITKEEAARLVKVAYEKGLQQANRG